MNIAKQIASRMLKEFSAQDKGGIYGYTQRMLAYNSNKIEGSTLTEKQTANIFETGSLSGEGGFFRAKDFLECWDPGDAKDEIE